ncbi:MAG: hypothetical protein ABSC60_17850, partial [Acidobacteriota bacterium]
SGAGEKNDCAGAEAPAQTITTKQEPCQAMNACPCQLQKRGWPAQQPRREAERDARMHAVDFDHWAMQQGVRQPVAAKQLGLAPGTLAYWAHRWHEDYLEARPVGRPCHRSDSRLRNQAVDFMRYAGPRVSVDAVQATFPDLARREATNLRDRFRRLWKLDHQRAIHVLHWHHPRAVWAMDHTGPLPAIDGRWPYLLAVRDLLLDTFRPLPRGHIERSADGDVLDRALDPDWAMAALERSTLLLVLASGKVPPVQNEHEALPCPGKLARIRYTEKAGNLSVLRRIS